MSKGERRRTRVSSTVDKLPDDIKAQLDLKLTDTANTYEELALLAQGRGAHHQQERNRALCYPIQSSGPACR